MSSLSSATPKEQPKEKPTLPVNFAKVLQENHSDLRKYLSLQELIPLLRKLELLTEEEWDEISHKQLTRQQKIDYLVQLLPRKGEHAYEKFVTCLELEKEHSAHMELAEKIKETAAKLTEGIQLLSTNTYEEDPNMDMVVEMMTETLKSSNNTWQASPEVLQFQKLLEYANGLHGSQLTLEFNTQILAKHYREVRRILRNIKTHLKQDADYIHRNLDAASEESDYTFSRDSSCQTLHKYPIPCSTLSNEDLHESVMRESSSSTSTADETDDEHLNTVVELDEESQAVFRSNTALLNSGNIQRPESWPAYKKRRAAKTISQASKQFSEEQFSEELCRIDNRLPEDATDNVAATDVEISLDQEEFSCNIFAGYLLKEGNSEMSRKRYFTLTKEFLFYSKSEQDSRPLGMIPLIDLKLERKKKTTFEVINKRASLIKVKKPAKKHVQCYRAISLKASSEAEMMTWINKIEDAIRELRTQYRT
ncbi:uncharacterized protein [Dysidea avara]|uniref:uncharacterized protein isoform X2 n=1 Tax=Dysidea avara TaxID=196820 RepID=UPI00331EA913